MNQHRSSPLSTGSLEEDLRLSDVWRMIVAGRRWALGVPLVAAIFALTYVYLSDPQWESSAVVQIGQVGQAAAGAVAALVEATPRAVERVKLPAFQDSVLTSTGISTAKDDPKARLYRDSLRLRQPASTDLIELKLRGYSRDEARRLVEATVEQLRKSHDKLALPLIDSLRQQLDDVMRQLERANKERESLVSQISSGQDIDASNRFAETALLGQLITARDLELRQLRERMLMLAERLGPARTYPTSLLASVHVSAEPVSPRRAFTVLLAAVAGLVAGVVIALVNGGSQTNVVPESKT